MFKCLQYSWPTINCHRLWCTYCNSNVVNRLMISLSLLLTIIYKWCPQITIVNNFDIFVYGILCMVCVAPTPTSEKLMSMNQQSGKPFVQESNCLVNDCIPQYVMWLYLRCIFPFIEYLVVDKSNKGFVNEIKIVIINCSVPYNCLSNLFRIWRPRLRDYVVVVTFRAVMLSCCSSWVSETTVVKYLALMMCLCPSRMISCQTLTPATVQLWKTNQKYSAFRLLNQVCCGYCYEPSVRLCFCLP